MTIAAGMVINGDFEELMISEITYKIDSAIHFSSQIRLQLSQLGATKECLGFVRVELGHLRKIPEKVKKIITNRYQFAGWDKVEFSQAVDLSYSVILQVPEE